MVRFCAGDGSVWFSEIVGEAVDGSFGAFGLFSRCFISICFF